MLVERFTGMENTRRLAGTAALFFVLGLALAVDPVRAAPGDCSDPTTCGGGGGDTNSPPTVNVNNASRTVNEGQTASNTGTFSDPDGNATVTLSASAGSVTKDDANGTWNWSFNTNDGPDQSQTVTITASDGTDTVTTTFSLTVNNVAPTITLQNSFPNPVEGSDVYTYSYSVSDPGRPEGINVTFDCGSNGVKLTALQFGQIRCSFPNGPSSSVLSVTATDSDGAISNTSSVTVNVVNKNPTASLAHPTTVSEGGNATLWLDGSDVQADKDAGLRYAFACNGGPLDGATYANAGTIDSTTCVQDDNGTKTVRGRVIDRDGGYNEYTKEITVTNVAPRATFEAPASSDQGGNFTLSLTNVTDPSSADRASLAYAFDCGNGSGYVSVTTASKDCTALDQPNMTVKGKVTDKDGGTNEYTKTVSVNNVAPTGTVQVNNDAAATNNATVSLTLSATDPLPGSGVGHMRFRNENTDTWSAWEPYSTSRSWLLSNGDGTKTVHVEYRDNAGNVSTVAIQDSILLDTTTPADTTAPGTTITSGPSGAVNSISASFGFSSGEAGASFECKLDGGDFVACASPKGYSGLSNGSHTFFVRAKDAAGNVDATPAVRTWTVDTVKPTISGMSPRHGSVIRDTTPTIKAIVKDNRPLGKASIKLYVAGKRIPAAKLKYSASGLLVYNSPKLAKGKKTVRVVATDSVGNVGAKSWYFTIK